MNEAAQMHSDSNAVNVNGQSIEDVLQSKNLGIVAGNSNHLEMLSQYTVPGVVKQGRCIENTSMLKCSNIAIIRGWTRRIVNQVVVLRIHGTKVRLPCKMSHLHFCYLCKDAGHRLL